MATSLKTVKIIGYFSIPSPWIAEHNPEAYSKLLAEIPHGAGTCSQCGMGLTHHVVIKEESGDVRFIGTDCALKIGIDSNMVKTRMTSEQQAAIDAKRAERDEKFKREHQEWLARKAANAEKFADLITILNSKETEFHSSLAAQLIERGRLSDKQATFVAKATSDTGRRNKSNADAWDAIISLCTNQPE